MEPYFLQFNRHNKVDRDVNMGLAVRTEEISLESFVNLFLILKMLHSLCKWNYLNFSM